MLCTPYFNLPIHIWIDNKTLLIDQIKDIHDNLYSKNNDDNQQTINNFNEYVIFIHYCLYYIKTKIDGITLCNTDDIKNLVIIDDYVSLFNNIKKILQFLLDIIEVSTPAFTFIYIT